MFQCTVDDHGIDGIDRGDDCGDLSPHEVMGGGEFSNFEIGILNVGYATVGVANSILF